MLPYIASILQLNLLFFTLPLKIFRFHFILSYFILKWGNYLEIQFPSWDE